MSKIALITDLHFGCRNNSIPFNETLKSFYTNQFFPYLKDNNIDKVICLGDTFDVRKNINIDILKSCKSYFFDVFERESIEFTMLVGNHDAYFKDTIKVNTPRELLKDYTMITVIDEPQELERYSILMLPWICRDNVELSMKLLEESKMKYCFGHFEIQGFKMYKSVESHGGFDRTIFNRFKKVFSGHYHTRSTIGNITYLGTAYEMNWADYDDPKGFHIFDTDIGELTFIPNNDNTFMVIEYKEGIPVPYITNKVVRIKTKNVESKTKLDLFIKEIQEQNPIDMKIVDADSVIKVEEFNDEILKTEDTVSIMSAFVDGMENDLIQQNLDASTLKKILVDMYKEAQEL